MNMSALTIDVESWWRISMGMLRKDFKGMNYSIPLKAAHDLSEQVAEGDRELFRR